MRYSRGMNLGQLVEGIALSMGCLSRPMLASEFIERYVKPEDRERLSQLRAEHLSMIPAWIYYDAWKAGTLNSARSSVYSMRT